jgi:hypothetical protein
MDTSRDTNPVSTDCVVVDDGVDLAVTKARDSLSVRIDKDLVISIIMSCGIVAALIIFVQESFAHPNAANVVIPLILGPVGTFVVNMLKRKCEPKICTKCGEKDLKP